MVNQRATSLRICVRWESKAAVVSLWRHPHLSSASRAKSGNRQRASPSPQHQQSICLPRISPHPHPLTQHTHHTPDRYTESHRVYISLIQPAGEQDEYTTEGFSLMAAMSVFLVQRRRKTGCGDTLISGVFPLLTEREKKTYKVTKKHPACHKIFLKC